MNKKSVNIAKITRPQFSQFLYRQRLSRKMEESGEKHLTWVSGPPGSGKTSLVNSFVASSNTPCLWYKIDSYDINPATFFHYLAKACQKVTHNDEELLSLTTKHTLGISEFSRNFFTKLISRLHNTFCLVLDNYQNIPEDIPLHELLLDALNLMPEGAHIIIISRNEPSSKFSRLGINRRINHIGWQDLRFSSDEFLEVSALWGFGDLPRKEIRTIHNMMDGWIAGLVFMLESTKKYNTSLQNIGTGGFKAIFNYFAEEIFDYQGSEVKNFLLKTSLLPAVTVKQAIAITGIKRSDKILASLHHQNLFVHKPNNSHTGAYSYHPLFKEFLSDRLVIFVNGDEIVTLQRRAAAMLLEDNQFEEAAGLLKKAKDWDGLINVMTDKAEWLMAQGRSRLLQQWLADVPHEKLRQNPWLSYWWGQTLQHDKTSQAKSLYSTAFAEFCEQQDMVGAFSSWSGLVEIITNEWHNFKELDSLIEWGEQNFDHGGKSFGNELLGKISIRMILAMMIRRPDSKSLKKWVEIATAEAQRSSNAGLSLQVSLVLAYYYLWRGDQSNCWVLLGRIRNFCRESNISPLSVLNGKCLEATMYAWLLTDGTKCMNTVEQALEIGQFSGDHSMDHRLYIAGAYGAFIDRNYTRMADYIQKIENLLDNSHQHLFFFHNYLSAWLSLAKGNMKRGGQHARQALQIAETTGHVSHETLGLFVEVHILHEKGNFQEAKDQLEQYRINIETSNSMLLQYNYFLTKAQFCIDLGEDELGLKYLSEAMKLGRDERYQRLMCWWNPVAMSKLSMLALDNDIETEYVRDLVGRQGIVPASSPIHIEKWPWPIKIYTLGRFEIVKNGQPVRAGGKAQQKPLSLLKVLISLGGRSVAEYNLADALWPDADGDMQHQSLATTLHRLRRILGGKDMIDFQDGHISLNPKYCWVDAWAFERLLSQAETEIREKERGNSFYATRYAEKAIALYKGNFLSQNNADHWSIHMRERLKSRFLRGVSLLGRTLEKIEEQQKAANVYLRALETEPLAEEFYQRLIICYHRMGHYAEAILVYRRCQKNFARALKISPSTQTKALYNNLLAKQNSSQEKVEPNRKKFKM